MSIKRCKRLGVLPKKGTAVRTKIKYTKQECQGFFVASRYITSRRSAEGEYIGFAAGTGGDVWWVEHESGEIAAYAYTEVFDR